MNRRTADYRRGRRDRALCRGCGSGPPAVSRLSGPGGALCRSDAQHCPLLGSASGRDEDGSEPGLQDRCCGANAVGRGGVERRRRRLAELQQDARFGTLCAARRDQRSDGRQAQGLMHVRHQTIYELRVRPDRRQRRPDRRHPDRHFLDRPGDLRRELAHARGRPALDPVRHARGGLLRRHAVPRIPGWAGARL